MDSKNFLVFLVLAFLILIGYTQLRMRLWRQPQPVKIEHPDEPITLKQGGAPAVRGDGARFAMGSGGALAQRLAKAARTPVRAEIPPTDPSKLIHLGNDDNDPASRFHLNVDLDPRGAGVRSVVLNKFEGATKEGRPMWADEDKKIPAKLELIPGKANTDVPAFALYHYDPHDLSDDHPLDTLGRTLWTVAGDKNNPITVEQTQDGRQRHSVTFQTDVEGVRVSKTFSLTEGDYHIGLEVKLARKDDSSDTSDRPFRYQLAGGRGLPVEGEWYTNIFRNALIARVDRGNVYRELQDLRQIALWDGGNEVVRDKNLLVRYAGVAVQYFASVIAVDNEQKRTDFLLKARATLETTVTKGKLKSVSVDHRSIVLSMGERPDETFYVPPGSDRYFKFSLSEIREGQLVAVVHHTDGMMEDGRLRAVALDIRPPAETQPLFYDDITARVATEPLELKPGMEVSHKYVLYHGPVKAMLLGQLTGDAAVPPAVVDRYLNDLYLNTLTDYQSPGIIGKFTSSIYWSQLIIHCTNIMHEVLNWLHKVIPNYGICIIVLTVLVRGMMFPVSRKQALTSIRIQELAPETKKLQEKYKDDRQALGMAQMELYRKHGVSPFGSCWMLLLQMPIFMGLYYCLQESIHFRLAQFWPSWIINLAAPDMLFNWGNGIPFISRPEDYGGPVYLGPYFNLLPVIAVALMMVTQKMTMPPPTDEQQEMQQKMMKYMTVIFGLMFYKVAAGLCIYFISSSLWGIAERKLLPKKKPKPGEAAAESLLQRLTQRGENGSQPNGSPAPAASAAPAGSSSSTAIQEGRSGKRKKGKRRRDDAGVRSVARGTPDTVAATGIRGWWQVRRQKLADWWQEVLRQAEKKG